MIASFYAVTVLLVEGDTDMELDTNTLKAIIVVTLDRNGLLTYSGPNGVRIGKRMSGVDFIGVDEAILPLLEIATKKKFTLHKGDDVPKDLTMWIREDIRPPEMHLTQKENG